MTPLDLTTARQTLGMTAADLGRALELEGRDPGRFIRAWEKGTHRVPGPVHVAVRYMLQEKARQGIRQASEQARAILAPVNPSSPVMDALDELDEALQFETAEAAERPPIKTRRRGQ